MHLTESIVSLEIFVLKKLVFVGRCRRNRYRSHLTLLALLATTVASSTRALHLDKNSGSPVAIIEQQGFFLLLLMVIIFDDGLTVFVFIKRLKKDSNLSEPSIYTSVADVNSGHDVDGGGDEAFLVTSIECLPFLQLVLVFLPLLPQ